jgi:hypothetical protein
MDIEASKGTRPRRLEVHQDASAHLASRRYDPFQECHSVTLSSLPLVNSDKIGISIRLSRVYRRGLTVSRESVEPCGVLLKI